MSIPIVWSNNVADPLGTMKMADYARYRALLKAMKVGRFEISPIMSGEQVVAFSISPLPTTVEVVRAAPEIPGAQQ